MERHAFGFVLEKEWPRIRRAIRERWSVITDDELDVINGQVDMMIGVLQEHYWVTKEEAEELLREFVDELEERYRDQIISQIA